MADGKTYKTKRKATRAIKKANPGSKVVAVNKRNIKKYGSSITKESVKAGYGKKKPGVGKGKVVKKIKYVAPVKKKVKTKPIKTKKSKTRGKKKYKRRMLM